MHPSKQLCVLFTLLATQATAQSSGDQVLSLSGYVGIASDLVYRGVDLADETVVPHIDVALEHQAGFYLHGRLTRVRLPMPVYATDQDSRGLGFLDAGYSWRPAPEWTLTLAHSWYHFDDAGTQDSPDYREWAISFDYSALFALDYAHSAELWGLNTEQDMISVSARWPLTRRLLGAATLGRIEQDGYYQVDYTFAHFNLGLLIQDWSVQLQYHDTFDVAGNYLDGMLGNKWVAQVNWHW